MGWLSKFLKGLDTYGAKILLVLAAVLFLLALSLYAELSAQSHGEFRTAHLEFCRQTAFFCAGCIR